VTQADLLRYGWLAMFLIGIVGATFLVGLFVQDRLQPWVRRDPVLKTQADSTVTDGVLLWICAVCSLGGALAAIAAQPTAALILLVAFGFFFNVMILNMLRGRRAVTRALRLATDKLDGLRAKMKASK
jgi:energy-converting hydrogenase Eha subunit C